MKARREREEEAWIAAKQGETDSAGFFEAKLAKIIIDSIKNSKEKMSKLEQDINDMRNLQVWEGRSEV